MYLWTVNTVETLENKNYKYLKFTKTYLSSNPCKEVKQQWHDVEVRHKDNFIEANFDHTLRDFSNENGLRRDVT